MTDIVGKLWGFCHTLRHDGIDYGDLTKKEKDELVTNCDRICRTCCGKMQVATGLVALLWGLFLIKISLNQ
jgi:hypothetical protein